MSTENKLDKFFKEFAMKIFPTMKGEDGKGIEKFRAIVDEKRTKMKERNRG